MNIRVRETICSMKLLLTKGFLNCLKIKRLEHILIGVAAFMIVVLNIVLKMGDEIDPVTAAVATSAIKGIKTGIKLAKEYGDSQRA